MRRKILVAVPALLLILLAAAFFTAKNPVSGPDYVDELISGKTLAAETVHGIGPYQLSQTLRLDGSSFEEVQEDFSTAFQAEDGWVWSKGTAKGYPSIDILHTSGIKHIRITKTQREVLISRHQTMDRRAFLWLKLRRLGQIQHHPGSTTVFAKLESS